MSAQHTPGPWEIEEDDYGDEIWLGGDGCGMLVVNGWVNGGCKDNPNRWAALQAEACLIAAAPDLLAALEAGAECLVSWMEAADPDYVREPDEQVLAAMRAAIAKATGQ